MSVADFSESITVEFHCKDKDVKMTKDNAEGLNIHDILDLITDFLKSAGYTFDGEIGVIKD